LASEQVKLGHEVTLVCLDYPHLGPQVDAPGVRVVSVKGNILAVRGRGWCPELRRVVMEEVKNADIVHNHGLWMWPNAYAREAAAAAGKPLVISPRGMMESWSLNRSKLRKAVAWRLFEKKNLQSAIMFHATAASEAESIREVTKRLNDQETKRAEGPIVVAPNGVDLPDLENRPGRELLEGKFPQLRARNWVVFMSRLHPKKGIDVLLRAWARQKEVTCEKWRVKSGHTAAPPHRNTEPTLRDSVSSAHGERGQTPHRGAVLVLAGSDLIGYGKDIERMVRDLRLEDSVVIVGEVRGDSKDCLLANADVFVLPSYSENFGIVVAEAMAWGRPVIASTGAPWKEVADVGAGWWVKPEEGALAGALEEALGKRREELEAMGAKGRALVAERYTWAAPAAKLVRAYEEIGD